MQLAIIIPIHNEAAFLPEAWPKIVSTFDGLEADVTVILVENGSTDDTLVVAESIEDPRLRVVSLAQPDYGAAMRAGFLEAQHSDWVVNFDIDYFSGTFLSGIVAGHDQPRDIVIASKRAPGSEDRRTLLRRTGTLVFNGLLRTMFGSNVSDTHGIKAFRGTVIDAIVPLTTRTEDLFDTELVLRAERAGYRIDEVPVIVEELREARSSFVSRIPRTLRGLAQLRASFSKERRNTTSR